MRPFFTSFTSCALLAVLGACDAAPPGVARGEAIFDTCSPCHGEAGEGNEVLEAPPLAGASAWYLTAQLSKFQEGSRGYHYQDLAGLRMRPMSRALTSPEDIESIVAYIGTLEAADPEAAGAGDVTAGAQEYTTCTACHGPAGDGIEALNAPSLLHLPEWYIVSSVQKYRDGIRGASPGDAAGATMRPIAMGLSDDQIRNVASFVQTLGTDGAAPTPAATPTPADAPAMDIDPSLLPEGVTAEMVGEGQAIFGGAGICYTCHLPQGAGGPLAPNLQDGTWLNIDGSYPAIVELINTGVPQPEEHPGAMLPRAGMNLTDDQVAAVAAYVYMLSR